MNAVSDIDFTFQNSFDLCNRPLITLAFGLSLKDMCKSTIPCKIQPRRCRDFFFSQYLCDFCTTVTLSLIHISRTLRAVKRAQEKGIRFMIATGRNFKSAMEELKDLDLTCDYLVGSGAEVRTPDQKIIKSCPISAKLCREAYEVMKEYPISILFSGAEYDYRIGTEEERCV